MANVRNKKGLEPKIAILHVGTAIRRLVDLQYFLNASRVDPPHVIAERDKIEEALNNLSFKIGFTCKLPEGLEMLDAAEAHPNDTAMEIFKRDASSSCCRVVFAKDESRTPAAPAVKEVGQKKRVVRADRSRSRKDT